MTRRRILLGRLAGVCAVAFCAFVAARADDVYLLRSDAKIDNVDVRSFEAAGNWSNGEAPSDAHDYYVMTNYSLRVTGSTAAHVFKGNSLTLGGTGSGDNFKSQFMGWGGQADVTISNLVVYQSTIQCNNEGWFYLKGTTTVRDTVGDRIFTGINHNTGGGRNFDVQCKMKTVGDESPKVIFKHGKNAADTYTTFKMSGDFTECKAWFEVQGQNSGLAIFLLDTATFGTAFDSVKTNAVQLRTNSKIVFTPNAVQNANAGISVPAGQTAYFGTRTYSASGNCKGSVQYDYPDHDLLLPVFGSGTFTKEDDGRITLKNDWSGFHGTVAIEGGSLILTDDMTTSADMRVVVKAGGVLETARTDGTYGGLDVTFEAGAGLIVPYNAETCVSAPITLGQSFLESCTYPVGLKLSQPISFPVNATNRLPVAKVDPAIRVVTGTDFTDTTTKTYDLPKTWFEVETDGAGMQIVYMVVKPVLVHEGSGYWVPFEDVFMRDKSNSPSNTDEYVWSDHLAAHPGADYIHTGTALSAVSQGGPGSRKTFDGDSLVFQGGSISSRSEHVVLPHVMVVSPSMLFSCAGYAPDSRHRFEGGPIYVSAASTTEKPLEFRGQAEQNHTVFRKIDLWAPLEGPGSVMFRTYDPPNDAYISCEMPNFKGILIVDAASGDSLKDGLSLHVNSPLALGGRPDAYESRGLQLRNHSCIAPAVSMTLDNSLNRGLVIVGANGGLTSGGFDVPSNVVLTLSMSVIQNGTLLKKGAGALAINSGTHGFGGWGSDATTGTNNVVEVRAGGVTTMKKANNVNSLCYVFKDGGGIAVFQTPLNAAQEENGLYASFMHERAFSHEAPIRVMLADAGAEQPATRFSRVVCTIPQALNPKTDFAVDKPWDGWRGEVTRADDTPSTGMYRYTVTYRPVGMTVIFR